MDENAMAELMAGGGSESDDAVDVDEEEESKLENQPRKALCIEFYIDLF